MDRGGKRRRRIFARFEKYRFDFFSLSLSLRRGIIRKSLRSAKSSGGNDVCSSSLLIVSSFLILSGITVDDTMSYRDVTFNFRSSNFHRPNFVFDFGSLWSDERKERKIDLLSKEF